MRKLTTQELNELTAEIADYNARNAQTHSAPDAATHYDGGIADDDPDWIEWQARHGNKENRS